MFFDTLLFYLNGNRAIIEEINIDSEYKKLGIGDKLMQRFESDSKKKNVQIMQVYTKTKFMFYEKMGFEKTGTFLIKQISQL